MLSVRLSAVARVFGGEPWPPAAAALSSSSIMIKMQELDGPADQYLNRSHASHHNVSGVEGSQCVSSPAEELGGASTPQRSPSTSLSRSYKCKAAWSIDKSTQEAKSSYKKTVLAVVNGVEGGGVEKRRVKGASMGYLNYGKSHPPT